MNRNNQNEYLLNLIKDFLHEETGRSISAENDWEYLFEISKKHSIQGIVFQAIEKLSDEQQPPREIYKKFKKAWQVGLAQEAVQRFALEEILDSLEKEKVRCLPLKGSILKSFYPSPDLRIMADIDIFYDYCQKEQVDRVLEQLGYTMKSSGDHDASWYCEPNLHIEMHYQLLGDNSRQKEYYKNVWDKLHLREGKQYIYDFSWEDYYIYMMLHLAKHFYAGGSGIRSVIDVWIFLEKMEKDLKWDYIDREVEQIGLHEFENHIKKLAQIWFGDEESDEFYDKLTLYIINSGVFGIRDYYNAVRVVERSGTNENARLGWIKNIIETVFLPLKEMIWQYPYLKKYPVLLPVAWVQRGIRHCSKEERKNLIPLFRALNVKDEESRQMKELMKVLGL